MRASRMTVNHPRFSSSFGENYPRFAKEKITSSSFDIADSFLVRFMFLRFRSSSSYINQPRSSCFLESLLSFHILLISLIISYFGSRFCVFDDDQGTFSIESFRFLFYGLAAKFMSAAFHVDSSKKKGREYSFIVHLVTPRPCSLSSDSAAIIRCMFLHVFRLLLGVRVCRILRRTFQISYLLGTLFIFLREERRGGGY